MGSVLDLWLDLKFVLFDIDWLNWKIFTVGPIWLFVMLISIIAIWIGYSMLTTPAPVPLEELEEELASED
ncbi:MAG: hypothetical protein KGD58_16285 [Candidatus Lokiarchaeota archaeon]|nr:hypothetical protein [Candidatus Lokiarchaeota archaeon]